MTPWRRIGAMQSMFGTRMERGRAGRRADEKGVGREKVHGKEKMTEEEKMMAVRETWRRQ